MEAGPLLAFSGLSGEPSERLLPILQDIKLFQDILAKFKSMCVDPTEYACLKAIVLFKTGVWCSTGKVVDDNDDGDDDDRNNNSIIKITIIIIITIMMIIILIMIIIIIIIFT